MKKKKFLNEELNKRRFDAFDVINVMVFFATLVVFVFCFVNYLVEMIWASDKTGMMVQLAQRGLIIPILFIPVLIRKIFKIEFPKPVTICYYTFMFLSVYLGTFVGLFTITQYYDAFIHALSAMLIGFFGLFLLNGIGGKNTKLKPWFLFVFVLSFALAVGLIWELYEFSFDTILDLNMQKYKVNDVMLAGRMALVDTMTDIIANFGGALISAACCTILYIKNATFLEKFKVSKINTTKENLDIEE